ncbi:MAG: MFS transporter, partial [Chloroflexota bacterium]|nr:MFS transporter [Chloroflexota bacterium]
MAVVALETTVVTTALPTIVGEFGRLDLYPWAFSAYLLTSTVTVPLYGKLADIFGRKRVFAYGMVLFLLGSILCGLASGMGELILYRALQGLGAGAVMPTVFTLVADVYRLEERAKVQGAFSGLWGITSLAGPAAGAWLTVTWSWRAVFFVCVPFGVLAGLVLWRCYHERVERREVALDILGSGLLIAGLTILLLALTQGGVAFGWASPELLGLLVVSLALLVGFVLAERRAADPVLPLSLFGLRIMTVSSVCNFLCGAILFGVTSYVPLYVQAVRGEGAAGAGVALTPMLVAWAATGFFSPRLLLRYGFRTMAIGSSLLLLLGTAGLAAAGPDSPGVLVIVSMLCLGLGFGPGIAAYVMAVQESVPWGVRGVATSSTQLFRSLGGTIGVALLGALLQARLLVNLAAAELQDIPTGALLSPGGHGGVADVPVELVAQLQGALGDAIRPVFAVLLLLAVATLATVLVFGRGIDLFRRAPMGAR